MHNLGKKNGVKNMRSVWTECERQSGQTSTHSIKSPRKQFMFCIRLVYTLEKFFLETFVFLFGLVLLIL